MIHTLTVSLWCLRISVSPRIDLTTFRAPNADSLPNSESESESESESKDLFNGLTQRCYMLGRMILFQRNLRFIELPKGEMTD